MGFGSYDESEQQNEDINADDDDGGEGVNVHENDHEGEVTFQTDSTDSLLDQLEEIKDDSEAE